jgi:WD40 repeat protein
MASITIIQAHHPSFLPLSARYLFTFFLLLLFSISGTTAQEITGLQTIRTLQHNNYSVAAVDAYFIDGYQLIAYSNNSGFMDGDTLVIYDFMQDQVLAEIPGDSWSFDIRFINADQLLYRNLQTLYRVVNLQQPDVNLLLEGVRTFTTSADKSLIAMLRNAGDLVEVVSYNAFSGMMIPLEDFTLPESINDTEARLTFSQDGNFIALNGGYENDFVYIINRTTDEISKVTTPENAGTYSPVFYEQNGNLRLAVGGGYANGSIEIINVDALSVEASIPAFPLYNYALDFDQTNRYAVSGGYDGTIKLYRVEGTSFTAIDSLYTGYIPVMMFTQDNQYVLSGRGGGGLAWLNIHQVLTGTSGIPSISRQPLRLYPNPTTGLIQFDPSTNGRISIFDNYGRLVSNNSLENLQVDVSELPQGIYIMKTENEKVIRTTMFVKN